MDKEEEEPRVEEEEEVDVDEETIRREEQLIVSLFSPAIIPVDEKNSSNTSLPTKTTTTQGETLKNNIARGKHNDDDDDDDEYNERGFVEKKLKEAEYSFLGNKNVTTANITTEDISSRFESTRTPNRPVEPDRVSEYMSDLVSHAVNDAVNTASPNMIGHMTSSLPYYTRPLSRLVTAMNQNSVKTETANTVTFLERQAVAQLHRQLFNGSEEFYQKYAQDPKVVLGVFTSGGTLANITALWVSRNVAFGPQDRTQDHEEFLGIEKEGTFNAFSHYKCRGAVVLGSDLLHYSIAKGLDVLGLGTKSLITVPYDEKFRVRVDLLEAALLENESRGIRVISIIGIAGTTEAGSIDPLDKLADLAQKYGVHFHVDAAWGGTSVFSRKQCKKLKGIERADSVTLDGHKQLYMPMGCGLCFFRDPNLSRSILKTAKYIIRTDSHDLGKFTLEGSRPATAVYLHSNLNIFGVRGYEILVDRSARITQYMARRIRESTRFELIVEPQMNILLYRALPPIKEPDDHSDREAMLHYNTVCDEWNIRLQNEQKLRGRTFVSRTTVRSTKEKYHDARIVALRVVIANPLTYEKDIDFVLSDQLEILNSIQLTTSSSKVQEDEKKQSTIEVAPEKNLLFSNSSLGEEEYNDDDWSSYMASSTNDTKNNNSNNNKNKVSEEGNDNLSTTKENPSTSSEEKNSYWKSIWTRMPGPARDLFKNDVNAFLGSLVAPDVELQDEDKGLFQDERYRRHLGSEGGGYEENN